MPFDVETRSARPADAAQIAVLMAQLGYEVPPRDVAERLARIDSRREVFVATSAERIVGWTSVSVDESLVEGFSALIEGFVVDEKMRSRGIGQHLLRAAEDWARERGSLEIRVRSNVLRERAHRFYERAGYAKVKSQFLLRKSL
jgi:GNAT superfamily N-acetyltransferase